MKQMEKVLKALANRRRLEIVRLLKKRRRASVGEIADAISLSFRATSRHLNVLHAAEVLNKQQQSLNVWYFLPDRHVPAAAAIIKFL